MFHLKFRRKWKADLSTKFKPVQKSVLKWHIIFVKLTAWIAIPLIEKAESDSRMFKKARLSVHKGEQSSFEITKSFVRMKYESESLQHWSVGCPYRRSQPNRGENGFFPRLKEHGCGISRCGGQSIYHHDLTPVCWAWPRGPQGRFGHPCTRGRMSSPDKHFQYR